MPAHHIVLILVVVCVCVARTDSIPRDVHEGPDDHHPQAADRERHREEQYLEHRKKHADTVKQKLLEELAARRALHEEHADAHSHLEPDHAPSRSARDAERFADAHGVKPGVDWMQLVLLAFIFGAPLVRSVLWMLR